MQYLKPIKNKYNQTLKERLWFGYFTLFLMNQEIIIYHT